MPTVTDARLRGIVMLVGVAAVTAALGFATTAQLAALPDRSAGQDPVAQGGGRGPGMMGPGMILGKPWRAFSSGVCSRMM